MVSSTTFTAAMVARQHSLHTAAPNDGIVVASSAAAASWGAGSLRSTQPVTVHSAKEERKNPGFLSICKSLFAGGVAGGVSRTAVAPLERLKILQQVAGSSTKAYNGVYSG